MNNMNDKRTNFALFLILIVVVLYTEMFLSPRNLPPGQPSAVPSAQGTAAQPVIRDRGTESPAFGQQVASVTEAVKTRPSTDELSAAPATKVETGLGSYRINHLGARLQNARLFQYRDQLGKDAPVDLVATSGNAPLPLGLYTSSASDDRTQYKLASWTAGINPEGDTFRLSNNQELVLNFEGALSDGTPVKKNLVFRNSSYLISVGATLGKPTSDANGLWIEWTHHLADPANPDRINPWHFSVLSDTGSVSHIPAIDVQAGFIEQKPVKWAAFDNMYFTGAIVPQTSGVNSVFGREGNTFLVRARGRVDGGDYNIYAGPKVYEILKASGHDLQRSIDLGFFSFLAHPLLVALKFFHKLLGNWGLAIVLLTLAVKTLLFPLNQASFKSMKEMQKVQPEMQALRERIKDPNQLNQEVLALYKKHNINPMGGCLPIMLQIPVFFGLYSALQSAIELRHAPWALWIHDLSSPEQLYLFGIRFPVLIIIMGATMLIQQYLTPNPSADPTQKRTMLIVSLIFTGSFIIFPFPAGLALYMLVNTFTSIVQQMYIKAEGRNAFLGTMLASGGIFFISWILTRIG